MSAFPTSCPACSDSLEVTRLSCPGCQMQLEGRFGLPALLRLGREDLGFVLEFVKNSGSLKDLGKHLGQSYPTVRNRLDEIIEKLSSDAAAGDVEKKRKAILDALSKGQLSVREATKKLKEVGE